MKKVTGCLLLIMLVVGLMVSGCYAPAPAPPPAPGQVTIKNFAFSPKEITINVGDTVTWTNQDSVTHTTTGSIWDSGNLGNGQTYSKTFDKAGTYDYICTIHPNMKGKVIVE